MNQENKNRGCAWCEYFKGIPLRGFTEHGCIKITVKFCPNCGKPLMDTEENT